MASVQGFNFKSAIIGQGTFPATQANGTEPDFLSRKPTIDRLCQQKATKSSETLAASRITQSDRIASLEPG
jgi:hypothetical protein